ncbi:MAG: hypothetical protein ACK5V3_07670 [Bdellovibrionales bacterium]
MKILIIILLIIAAVVVFFVMRKSEKPNRRIQFEIQVEDSGQPISQYQLTLVNNDKVFASLAGVRMQSQVKTSLGAVIKTEPTLINRDLGRHALVIKTTQPLAQVFELPQKSSEVFEWSPWIEVAYFEDSEVAAWKFMDKIVKDRKTNDPLNPKIKIRFKSEAFNVEKEFQEYRAQSQKLTQEEILRVRKDLLNGKEEVACQLITLDPRATDQEFLFCKNSIESKVDKIEKWELLKLFTSNGSGRAFVSWCNDEYSDDSKVERSWTDKKNSIPSEHQLWFLKIFYETWLNLDDKMFLETMPNIRHCISDMFRTQWTDESFEFISNILPPLLQDRLDKAKIEYSKEEVEWFNEAMASVRRNP